MRSAGLDFARNFFSYVQNTRDLYDSIEQKIANHVNQHVQNQLANYTQNALWVQHGKPLYERYIQPLTRTDYRNLTAAFSTTGVVAYIAIHSFAAFFPLAMVANALILFGTCSITQKRVQHHFNRLVWGHLDLIRRAVNDVTNTNKDQKLNDIDHQRSLLQKPEFEHLKEEFRQLDDHIRTFRNAAVSPYLEEVKARVLSHIGDLKNSLQGHSADLIIVNELEQEITRIGTDQQDLALTETKKQALRRLQARGTRQHLAELYQQIEKLIQAAQGPHIMKSKETFIRYLEDLMRRLDEMQAIQALPPVPVIAVVPRPQPSIVPPQPVIQRPPIPQPIPVLQPQPNPVQDDDDEDVEDQVESLDNSPNASPPDINIQVEED